MTHISEVIDDELRYYLITYYDYLMTKNEFNAYKIIGLRLKFSNGSLEKSRRWEKGLADGDNPEVQALLANGEHAFFIGVCERLLRERQDKIFLN